MQRIMDLFYRCRHRPIHQLNAPLLIDEEKYNAADEKKADEKTEVKETKNIVIPVDDPIAEFKANRAELKRCIMLFKKQKRKARACFLAPGVLSGISAIGLGGVLIYFENKITSDYSSAYNAFSNTRTNCTYIDYSFDEGISKNFSNISCRDIHYPFAPFRGLPDLIANRFCRSYNFCCDEVNYLHLQNTTGLEVCTQLLFRLCDAYYKKNNYYNLNSLSIIGWIVVVAALIYFVANIMDYRDRRSLVIDRSRFKVSNDPYDIDMLYQVAQRYHIYQDSRLDFVSELRSHPTKLHSAYQELLRRLENKHIKFLSRFKFLQGLSHKERNAAPMRILAEAKHNFTSIFEYANVGIIDKNTSARTAFLSTSHDQHAGTTAHQFFKSIKEEKRADEKEIYEKKEMLDTIFRFAGI